MMNFWRTMCVMLAIVLIVFVIDNIEHRLNSPPKAKKTSVDVCVCMCPEGDKGMATCPEFEFDGKRDDHVTPL